ncbi:MAG: PAS domain S-box protein [Flavobacteriaceae bacterium]|nr:PAS domain S-box protein [Flavobacteriaceae bacterium]
MIKSLDIQIIQQLPTALAVLNKNKELIYASDLWFQEFGLDKKAAENIDIFTLLAIEDPRWDAVLDSCLQGASLPFSTSLEHNPNKWYQFTNSPYTDADNNIKGVLIQAQDITTSKHYSEKLRESNIVINDLLQNSKIGRWKYLPKENKLTWDLKTREIYGVEKNYQPKLIKSLSFIDSPSKRSEIQNLFNKSLKKNMQWEVKTTIANAKENQKQVLLKAKSIGNAAGIHTILGSIQLLNEREIENKSQEAPLHANPILKSILDNIPYNIFVKDRNHKRIMVNNNELAFLGLEKEADALGKNDLELYPNHLALKNIDEDNHIFLHQEDKHQVEYTLKSSNEKNNSFSYSKIPLSNPAQKCNFILGIGRAINDQKEREKTLKKTITTVGKQEKKLREFTDILSHNLRSHAANFSMLLELIVPNGYNNNNQQLYQMLKKSSDTMLETIEHLNEMVTIKPIPKEKRSLQNAHKICNSVIKNLIKKDPKTKAYIQNLIPKDAFVLANKPYVSSILHHLICNSLRYKHPDRSPEITISFSKTKKYSVVEIADNGLGIDLLRNKHKLFGMYKVFHNHPEAKGFGLFMTKAKIDALNGKITVESKIDKGTTFKVFFNEKD